MTQQNLDFEELQELKNQFNLLDMKLKKQRIINEEMIQESMKEKLSYIEKWYRDRLIVCLVAAPIASIFFYGKYITEGFGHWGFSLMILVIGLLEFFLDRKSYKALDVKNLSNMNMTQATENIIKHKQLRNMTNKISILPFIILTIWTILIASGYTWNLPIIMFTIFMFGISFSCELYQMKKNQKRLESVLEQIKKLRE